MCNAITVGHNMQFDCSDWRTQNSTELLFRITRQKEVCTEHERYCHPLHCSCYFLQCDTRRQFESRHRRRPLYEDEGVRYLLIIQLKPSVATVKSVTCRARSKSSPRGCTRHEGTNNDILIHFWILVPGNIPPHEDTNCKSRIRL